MATTTFSLSNALGTSGTQSYLNTWGAAIVSALTACGLVQTSDTGQISWSSGQPTVVTGAGGTTYGFQIWRFNDTLQSSKPVYIKVTYVQGTTNGALYLNWQIGTGTNGAGTLTGVTSGSVSAITMAGSGGQFSGYTSGPCYGSGDGSYLTLVLDATASSAGPGAAALWIDRTRDLTGAATSEGVVFGLASLQTNTGTIFGIMNFTAGTTVSSTSIGCMAAGMLPVSLVTTMAAGSTVYVAPGIVICNGKLLPPCLAAVGYYSADTTLLVPISVNIAGSPHTYLPLGAGVVNAAVSTTSSGSMALRYE